LLSNKSRAKESIDAKTGQLHFIKLSTVLT